jgi:guanine nucleotide-binding protein G(I)/G(S)/G(T) subunit beta-1
MESTRLKIQAIDKSIEQMQKSIIEKNPPITISKYKSTMPQIKCRFAESIILRGHSGKVNSIAWNKGSLYKNKVLGSVSSDGSIILWNAYVGSPICKWVLSDSILTTCVFEPISGNLFGAGSLDGGCYLYKSDIEPKNPKELQDAPLVAFHAHDNYISELVFLDPGHLITASGDNSLKIWDLTKPDECALDFNDHKEDVMCVDAHDNLIISGSCDHTAKLWDTRQKKMVRSFNIHFGDVNSIKFISPYSFITGSADGFIRLLDLRGLNVLGHYKTGSKIESVEASYSGRVLFSSCDTEDVLVWDIMNESSPIQILPRSSPCVKLNNEAVYLAGASEHSIVLWQHVMYSN